MSSEKAILGFVGLFFRELQEEGAPIEAMDRSLDMFSFQALLLFRFHRVGHVMRFRNGLFEVIVVPVFHVNGSSPK